MDKKIIKIIGIAVGVLVIIIVILFIIAACSKKKFDFYKFQSSMIEASKNYYKNKKDELPKEDGNTKTITLKKLISEGYLKEPAEEYKDETLSCDGSVTVTNNSGYYLFTPSLTCGKNNRTQLFIDRILDDSLVEEGVGLYKMDNTYVYRGEVKNNYVKIDGVDKLFRIIRVNEDGSFRLIDQVSRDDQGKVWDNRYNPTTKSSDGVNDFVLNSINSRIKETLKTYWEDSTRYNDKVKAYILTQELCIGKRAANDTTKDGSTECSVKLTEQKLGLLNTHEFLTASLDEGCQSTKSISCQNYNWLSNTKTQIWTLNGVEGTTQKVWFVRSILSETNANSVHTVQPVVNISDKVTYVSGNGTQDNPYIIR